MNAPLATPTTLIGQEADLLPQDCDELLQASRRVDWRFLLPQPDLGATAYIGDADRVLIDSLQRFCSSLVMLEGETQNAAPTAQFPLVVASNPNQQELARATQAACDGGFVYLEVSPRRGQRNLRSRGSRRLSRVNTCLAAMRELHLSELQSHWHWPNLESCNEIIPLQHTAAVVCALRRRGSGFQSKWKSTLALALLKCHLLTRLVPCFSVLGRKYQSMDSGYQSSVALDI